MTEHPKPGRPRGLTGGQGGRAAGCSQPPPSGPRPPRVASQILSRFPLTALLPFIFISCLCYLKCSQHKRPCVGTGRGGARRGTCSFPGDWEESREFAEWKFAARVCLRGSAVAAERCKSSAGGGGSWAGSWEAQLGVRL